MADDHDRPPLNAARTALVAAGVALVATPPATGQRRASSPLTARLTAALAVPGLDPHRTGAIAIDLGTGRVVFARNASLSLRPASNEKLSVLLAALISLGPAFRMHTDVLGEGRLVSSSVWRGRLVLKGFGDPTLSSAGLTRLAVQIRALGIRRVTGAIVADEAYFDARRTAPGWPPSFFLEESPPLGALVVDRARVAGTTTTRPALAAATLFRDALRRMGIRVLGPVEVARTGGLPLASIHSPPLAEIARAVAARSDNFTAEMLLKELGAAVGGAGTSAAGDAVVRSVLAGRGIPLEGARIADGSGLSPLDRLTPRTIASILAEAWRDPALRRPFVGALAVAGRTGTLRHRLGQPPARGNVRAKTGTTDFASALSGFVRDRYAFALVQNGDPVSTLAAHAAQDRFVTVLASA